MSAQTAQHDAESLSFGRERKKNTLFSLSTFSFSRSFFLFAIRSFAGVRSFALFYFLPLFNELWGFLSCAALEFI